MEDLSERNRFTVWPFACALIINDLICIAEMTESENNIINRKNKQNNNLSNIFCNSLDSMRVKGHRGARAFLNCDLTAVFVWVARLSGANGCCVPENFAIRPIDIRVFR